MYLTLPPDVVHVNTHKRLHLISLYPWLFCKPNIKLQSTSYSSLLSCLDFISPTQLFLVTCELTKRELRNSQRTYEEQKAKIRSMYSQTCLKGKKSPTSYFMTVNKHFHGAYHVSGTVLSTLQTVTCLVFLTIR